MRMLRVRRLVAAAALSALVMPSGVVAASAADEPSGPHSEEMTNPDDCDTEAPDEQTEPPADPDPCDDDNGNEPSEPPTEEPTDPPQSGAFKVTNAQFRWGMNNESNNRAYAPGTFNFFSAGAVVNPGAGGSTIQANGRWKSNGSGNGKVAWRAKVGKVSIQKRTSGTTYKQATLAGLKTDVNGVEIPNTWGNEFTDHQVVINGGRGQVDVDKGTATISWKGTWSVVYYSGMVFYTVTDPALSVTKNSAKVEATLGGFKSDQQNPDLWVPMKSRKVVIADLPRKQVDLKAKGGFNVTPAYTGVKVRTSGGIPAQLTTESWWGSFPQSFVDFQSSVGSGAYWYSSGGAADRFKPTLPMTISYAAGAPITPESPPKTEAPPEDGEPTADPTDPPTYDDPPPPSDTTSNPPLDTDQTTTSTAPTMDSPLSTTPTGVDSFFDLWRDDVPTVYALTSSDGALDSGHPWKWWTGSLLLLGAAVLSVLSRFAKGNR